MTLLNTGLLKAPTNYITVLLMLLIAGLAAHVVITYATKLKQQQPEAA